MSAMKRHAAYVEAEPDELLAEAGALWGRELPAGFDVEELRARCLVAGVVSGVGLLDEVEQYAGDLEAGEFVAVRKTCARCGVDLTILSVESTTIAHGPACTTDDGLALFTINWALS